MHVGGLQSVSQSDLDRTSSQTLSQLCMSQCQQSQTMCTVQVSVLLLQSLPKGTFHMCIFFHQSCLRSHVIYMYTVYSGGLEKSQEALSSRINLTPSKTALAENQF